MFGNARMRNRSVGVVVLGFVFAACAAVSVVAQNKTENKPESKNMELLGWNDLQGRSAYQPTIHHQGNRWIAYIGHHGGSAMNSLTGKMEDNGTSVVDVTDQKIRNILRTFPAIRASRDRAKPAERRWLACATAANCPAQRRTKYFCCARAALPRMKFGMSAIPQSQAA